MTDSGVPENMPGAGEKLDELRRTVAALPDNAPYVSWGRWFFADRATRPIAPGFTITAAEAEESAAETTPSVP
jgi:hypothetical protein